MSEVNDVTKDALKKINVKEYGNLVKEMKPKRALIPDLIWAFVIGGLICSVAQVIQNQFIINGASILDARASTAIIMIFLAALATGLGIYDILGERAGAGTIVPITGFANVIVASAMEFKKEGYVFGVGAKIFNVAGPTLVFGIVTAMLIGLIKVFLIS